MLSIGNWHSAINLGPPFLLGMHLFHDVTIIVYIHEEVLAPFSARLGVVAKHYRSSFTRSADCEVNSGIRASAGVRLLLRLLQGTQAVTIFSGELSPPRERGRM